MTMPPVQTGDLVLVSRSGCVAWWRVRYVLLGGGFTAELLDGNVRFQRRAVLRTRDILDRVPAQEAAR